MMTSAPEAVRRKALLIFPESFYSFADGIMKAMSAAGYDVVIANHEYPKNFIGKILGNLLIFRPLYIATKRVLYRNFVASRHYDLVLIVKGRGISRQVVEMLRHATPKIVAYNFDSFGYNPSPISWYKCVDKYCTFDYLDSEKYSIPLVELFSSVSTAETPKQAPPYDISAILRNHSNRLKYLDAVLSALPDKKAFIYIFELNIFTFVLNFIRNPVLYMKYRSNIHFKPLPYSDYVSVLLNSNFTLDYAHPKQSGITVRCFEAASTQTKIVTNNSFVRYHPFFNDENTLIFDGTTGLAQLRERFESISNSVPPKHHRTLKHFLDDLLA
jgi:hypothetical protein